uniref:BAG family molecular chaperone regulator 1 n=1 Tax=Coturnix japonica TaxID=93934 RepID=A0A8C2T4P3_COTJA
MPRAPSNLVLNTSRDGASTTSLGSLFQGLTTLLVKNFPLTSNLNLPAFNLKPFPCVLLLSALSKSNEKHNIQVASQQEDGEPTLQDMAVLIEQVTGVPVSFQKLIYKGKSLKELEQPLSALGVKNGCKVMLIGKRNSPEEEAELKKLKDLEKSVEHIANKLEEVNKEFTSIQKGFLAKDLQAEALKQLDKRIKGTAEQFMKILEQVDAINKKKGKVEKKGEKKKKKKRKKSKKKKHFWHKPNFPAK